MHHLHTSEQNLVLTVVDFQKQDDLVHSQKSYMSSVQNPCWLTILGDYTIQFIRDYNNPSTGNPQKNNQD